MNVQLFSKIYQLKGWVFLKLVKCVLYFNPQLFIFFSILQEINRSYFLNKTENGTSYAI